MLLDLSQYIYTEASSPTETGQRASLVTMPYKKGTDLCLSFRYNMYGEEMGNLKVSAEVIF